MEEEYIELLGADYKGTSPQGLIDSPFAINNYNINTPTRLLTGISYTLPKVGSRSASITNGCGTTACD
ncbi:MAG: hypothetical protein ACLR8Y_12550 [Alistipes indistinctus]